VKRKIVNLDLALTLEYFTMEKDIRTIKTLLAIIVGVISIYFVSVLSSMLIPLALALFLAILVQPILAWFERKSWPFGLSVVAISSSTFFILYLFSLIIVGTFKSLVNEKEKLLTQINGKLDNILNWINTKTNLTLDAEGVTDILSEMISTDWIIKSTGSFAGTFTNLVGDFSSLLFMTVLYFVALLGGILKYEQYIHYLEEGKDDSNLLKGFEQVKNSIVTYIKIKFLMSVCTGLGYAIVCWLFGIEFSPFWGFLAFVLNFIPTLGSIIATIPPLLLSLVELDSFGLVVFFLIVLFAIQMFFGNVVEPRLTGASLSLNTITVIFGLVFWGYLWGVTGMLLSVPLMVLAKVILDQFSETKIVVRLMGQSNI